MKYKADLVISIDYSDYESGAVMSIIHDDGSSNVIFATEDPKEIEDLEYICEQGQIKKLKVQAFDIINKKNVDPSFLKIMLKYNVVTEALQKYNNTRSSEEHLTLEELLILKETFYLQLGGYYGTS